MSAEIYFLPQLTTFQIIPRVNKMDNDTLINQARKIYAELLVKRYMLSLESTSIDRLNYVVKSAYCRYVRRLNRCVVCYQQRLNDCNREPGKDHTPCERRHASDHHQINKQP